MFIIVYIGMTLICISFLIILLPILRKNLPFGICCLLFPPLSIIYIIGNIRTAMPGFYVMFTGIFLIFLGRAIEMLQH
jgi:hypothetical protein